MRACALALLLWSILPAVSTAGHPLSLNAYRQAVHAVRVQLDRGERAEVRAGLLRLGTVRLTNGAVIHTGLPALAGMLNAGGGRSAVRTARQEIDALDDALRGTHAREVDVATLHSLDRILRDPVFTVRCSLMQCLGSAAENLIDRLLAGLSLPASGPGRAGLLLLLPFVAALLGVIVLLVRGGLARMVPVVEREVPWDRTARTAAEARRSAEKAAARGAYREALRHLFGATVLHLAERGRVHLRPGMTSREVVRLAAGNDEILRGLLTDMADGFERVRYGHMSLSAEGYGRYEELVRRLEERLRGNVA